MPADDDFAFFGIQPTFAWDAETNVYDTEMRRQSDIYVFCVLKHTDQETIDPLDAKSHIQRISPSITCRKNKNAMEE